MKSTPKKTLFLFCMLLISSLSFADIPDPNEDDISDESEEAALPIDSQLIWLGLIGASFAYYQFISKKIKE
ncbi:MAG: hypothetical protein V4572_01105 [Bacteroidota bacterium]